MFNAIKWKLINISYLTIKLGNFYEVKYNANKLHEREPGNIKPNVYIN